VTLSNLRRALEAGGSDLDHVAKVFSLHPSRRGFEATSGGLTDEPVAEIVQCGEPAPKTLPINNLQSRPIRDIELPQ